MDILMANGPMFLLAVLLVLINGFFVAAEFALVKVSAAKIDSFVAQKRAFAKLVRGQLRHLDAALSACQLGITLASLALGWIGEPALAKLIRPLLHAVGVHSEVVLHTIAFTIAFSVITALHLTIGEQVPKMYAIRNPERVAMWCALPLRIFCIVSYPFLIMLNASSNFLLALVGVQEGHGHEESHSEQEIRAMLAQAHSQGELSRSEHRLLDAVFEFDDRVVTEIMVPRREIVYFEEEQSVEELRAIMTSTRHTRYPYCRGSLDKILGIVHIKDLVGINLDDDFDFNSVLRPPQKVPEGIGVGKLLRQFQATKQLMAFVVDEFGNTIGVVTLENVLEVIVGSVQDEFDIEDPLIIPEEGGKFLIDGGIALSELARHFEIALEDSGTAETLSGLLTEQLGRLPKVGDTVTFAEMKVEVLQILDSCARRVRLEVIKGES